MISISLARISFINNRPVKTPRVLTGLFLDLKNES